MLVSLRKKHRFWFWSAVYKKDLQELPGEGITKHAKVGTKDSD